MPVAQHNANPDKSDILMMLYLTWEEPEEPRTQLQWAGLKSQAGQLGYLTGASLSIRGARTEFNLMGLLINCSPHHYCVHLYEHFACMTTCFRFSEPNMTPLRDWVSLHCLCKKLHLMWRLSGLDHCIYPVEIGLFFWFTHLLLQSCFVYSHQCKALVSFCCAYKTIWITCWDLVCNCNVNKIWIKLRHLQ